MMVVKGLYYLILKVRMKGKSPRSWKRLNMMSDVMVKESYEKTKWVAVNRTNGF